MAMKGNKELQGCFEGSSIISSGVDGRSSRVGSKGWLPKQRLERNCWPVYMVVLLVACKYAWYACEGFHLYPRPEYTSRSHGRRGVLGTIKSRPESFVT